MRPTAPIEQPGQAFGAIAAQPLVGRGAADAELLGRIAGWPALDHPAHQQLTAERGETRVG